VLALSFLNGKLELALPSHAYASTLMPMMPTGMAGSERGTAMRYHNHQWDWLVEADPLLALVITLPLMAAFTVGAALACLVTWMEDHLPVRNR
jgi:hypothetical protein